MKNHVKWMRQIKMINNNTENDKVKRKIWATSLMSFWYLYCWLWTYFLLFSTVSNDHFELENFDANDV